ncbi:unnamed protein product [Effrenium voratum]|nr:unnamed protein product [Effrenium voratum]
MDTGYLQQIGLDTRTAPVAVLSRTAASGMPAAAGASAAGAAGAASPAKAAASDFGSDLRGKGFDRSAVVRGNHPPWLVPNAGQDTGLQVVNSLTGEREPFRPLNGKKVIWYTCGPTVYDVAHMGHARAYLTFDILRRIMTNYLNFEVKYQINITDIDDKIILRARQNKLFSDFCKEAATMKPEALKKTVQEALQKKAAKLKAKEPQKPEGTNSRAQQEYETLVQEHQLKLQQHAELEASVEAALKSGKSEAVLQAAREVLMDALDKERGHTVTDHSIFDAHGRRFEEEYFEDMDALGILRPDVVTRITEYMDGRVQKFIERLEELGVAYASAGSVYFDIASFEKLGYHYRKLVPALHATAKEMEEGEGALAAEDAEKRSPNDFALWKKSKPGEPAWESKWGPGRPGWHIECSVMATDINGEYLDIHAGGEDLKFPHHDNEMAQSEAYLQRSQWVNYFWHAGHLHIEGLKMSKSLKNFITIRQALQVHSARQLRLMFLMQAWDKGMNYSDQAIDMAKAEERRAAALKVIRYFTTPWLKDWFEPPNAECNWWCPDAREQELFTHLVFLNKVGIPSLLAESTPKAVRPYLYVSVPLDLSALPQGHEYLRGQADSNGIPDMLKCDFLDPIICAMAESVFTLVQHDVDTHLVAVLDSSGFSREKSTLLLSFRIVFLELSVPLRAAVNVRGQVRQLMEQRCRESAPWLRLENWATALPEEVFEPEMRHPLAWCDWPGFHFLERRVLEPFALLHVRVFESATELEALEQAEVKIEDADWPRLGSVWPSSSHCRPERQEPRPLRR